MLHDFLYGPWPWYITGPAIGLVYFALYFVGKRFGVSGTMKAGCSMMGAGKKIDYFNFEWKNEIWNMMFAVGLVLGGVLGGILFPNTVPMELAEPTIQSLEGYGLTSFNDGITPTEIFSWESLFTLKGFIFIVVGGFFVGFGSRYADGCTSGHAITGLANLELPSLVAVIGFFIGGLFVTHVLMDYIMNL
jgi:uncharacterized membrane protein YedE/YeeE